MGGINSSMQFIYFRLLTLLHCLPVPSGHIFFDDAIETFGHNQPKEDHKKDEFEKDGKRVNSFVRKLIATMKKAR